MRVVRPIRTDDLAALCDLAGNLGPGMTTLPGDRRTLADKVERSVASFDERLDRSEAQYLLVMEDVESGSLLGVSALYPQIGEPHGFFSYKCLRAVQRSASVSHNCDVDLLMPVNDYTGCTEVGTLAVRPDLKGSGAGRLLAKARYLLVANRPDLFSSVFMAELRGWQDQNQRSPFWDALGERFFRMDFATADHLSATEGSQFIADLLPRYPIYITFLPERAREAIGRPHMASAPALAMLREEGFRYEGFVDVFDAGPQVHADRDSIRTVRHSRVAPATGMTAADAESAQAHLLCNCDDLAGFRMIAGPAKPGVEEIAIPDVVARLLDVEIGRCIRWVPQRRGA